MCCKSTTLIETKVITLPNRVEMIVIRMVIAMGWPPAKPAGEDPKPVLEQIRGAPYGGLMHRDMHEENSTLATEDSMLKIG